MQEGVTAARLGFLICEVCELTLGGSWPQLLPRHPRWEAGEGLTSGSRSTQVPAPRPPSPAPLQGQGAAGPRSAALAEGSSCEPPPEAPGPGPGPGRWVRSSARAERGVWDGPQAQEAPSPPCPAHRALSSLSRRHDRSDKGEEKNRFLLLPTGCFIR